MPPEFQTHVLELPASAKGLRLDQALAAALPQYSRARLQRWIRAGAVRSDGRPLRARARVQGGEQLTVQAQFADLDSALAQPLALQIVHEDAALLVLNKPAGLVVHPGAGNRDHTLLNALLAHEPQLARVPRAGLVHRLDKDTSGLLIIARTPEAHTRLVAALAEHAVRREYLALCAGLPTGGGRIDKPIGRHRSARTRMAVRGDGREAITHYRIEERFRAHTLLRVELQTGRTHQIRVHCAEMGWPVFGDGIYGKAPRHGGPPLHLQAREIAVPLYKNRAPIRVTAPVPPHMRKLLAACGWPGEDTPPSSFRGASEASEPGIHSHNP